MPGAPEAANGSDFLTLAAPSPPRPTTPRPAAQRPGSERPVPRLPAEPDGGTLDLSPGVPDLAAFPRAAWRRAERRGWVT